MLSMFQGVQRSDPAAPVRAPTGLAVALLLTSTGTAALGQETCTLCHANSLLIASAVPDSARAARMLVDPSDYRESIHGSLGFSCTACHSGVSEFPHGPVSPVDCGQCHTDVKRQVLQSVHGRPHVLTGTAPATCKDCHGTHHVMVPTNPQSTVYRLTLFETCATCHSDPERMALFGQTDVETVSTYVHSVHGRGLLEKGLTVAPTCTDCHGGPTGSGHAIRMVADSGSSMHRPHVVETCGRCHLGIVNQYNEGIHGSMLAEGNPDVPTCVGCHGEHAVQPVTSPASAVFPTHVVQTCSGCHDREELDVEYGLPPARRETYLGSFHGIALEGGQLTVANCESCHGAHRILPSSDPRSSIYPDNLVTTCGRCHPGIGEGVTQGKIHVASLREDVNLLAYGVQWFYYLLIAGILIYAAAMISLDQYRYRVVERRNRRGEDA